MMARQAPDAAIRAAARLLPISTGSRWFHARRQTGASGTSSSLAMPRVRRLAVSAAEGIDRESGAH